MVPSFSTHSRSQISERRYFILLTKNQEECQFSTDQTIEYMSILWELQRVYFAGGPKKLLYFTEVSLINPTVKLKGVLAVDFVS